jgi:hypothetical protein
VSWLAAKLKQFVVNFLHSNSFRGIYVTLK